MFVCACNVCKGRRVILIQISMLLYLVTTFSRIMDTGDHLPNRSVILVTRVSGFLYCCYIGVIRDFYC